MKFRKNSIKNQLLISFLPILGLFFFAMIGVLLLLSQANKVKSFKDQLVLVDNSFEMILTKELIFLQSEYNDFDFHENGESKNLEGIEHDYDDLSSFIDELMVHSWINELADSNSLSCYLEKIYHHKSIFDELVLLVRQRGVKDYGLIGEMRGYIHEMERENGGLPLTEILYLRRHEKDFLLRHQGVYIDKLQARVNAQLDRLKLLGLVNTSTYQNLNNYINSFNRLVLVMDSIGSFKQSGLKLDLETSISDIMLTSDSILDRSDTREQRILSDINLSFYAVLIFSFLGSVLSSFNLAKRRSEPIINLSGAIKQQIHAPGIHKIKPSSIKGASNELRSVINSFNLLIKKLKEQISVIEDQNGQLYRNNVELKKVNEELDNFVYRVSHDLRAPLSSISGLTMLNRINTQTKELLENNELIEASVNKMDAFIGDIINLSRNARVDIQVELIDLKALIEEVVDHHRFMKNADGLEVNINLRSNSDFYSDRQRLIVAFSNLIANAFKYSDLRKSVQHLNISGSIDAEQLIIEFEDNGVGIPEQYLSRIFEMFFRASYYSKGSGLGLYITKETIEKLGGSITVESVEGMMTVFSIDVPNLISKSGIHNDNKDNSTKLVASK